MKPRFKDGDRVRIKANLEEGWEEQLATVDGCNGKGVYIVTIDKPWDQDDHDGLREVYEDDLEAVQP